MQFECRQVCGVHPPGETVLDHGKFMALQSEFAAQLALVDDVFERIEDRALNFDADKACERQLESVAFQIHCAYNAFKSILRLIAARFEYRISDAARCHSALLPTLSSHYRP